MSEIGVQARLGSADSSFPSRQMEALLLSPPKADRRKASSLISLLVWALIPLDQGPTLKTSCNPNYLQISPTSNCHHIK